MSVYRLYYIGTPLSKPIYPPALNHSTYSMRVLLNTKPPQRPGGMVIMAAGIWVGEASTWHMAGILPTNLSNYT